MKRGLSIGALLLALLGSCEPAEPSDQNVLLVTIDTLRADRLSAHGFERDATPRLDAFAEEGVLFERAYSHAPFTAPAHASLFTSLVTRSHGVETWGRQLDPELPELFGLYRAAGYRTGAFYNHPGLVASKLLHSVDHEELRTFEPAEDTVRGFLDWAGSSSRQFVAWVHLWDVHRPYGFRSWRAEHLREQVERESLELVYAEGPWGGSHDPLVGRTEAFYNLNAERLSRPKSTSEGSRVLDESDLRYLEDRYDNAVRAADAGFGGLVDGLRAAGLLDTTLVVVTSDHGEALTERTACLFTHDPFLTEETLRVPLILRFPNANSGGTRVPDLVRGVDVLPTLLEFSGLTAPDGLQGRSLLPLVRGETMLPALHFAQTQTRHTKEVLEHSDEPVLEFRQALISGNHKLIHDRSADTYALYDLERDPGETTDLASDPGSAILFERLLAELAAVREGYPLREAFGTSSPHDQAFLDSIGYAGDE